MAQQYPPELWAQEADKSLKRSVERRNAPRERSIPMILLSLFGLCFLITLSVVAAFMAAIYL